MDIFVVKLSDGKTYLTSSGTPTKNKNQAERMTLEEIKAMEQKLGFKVQKELA